MCACEVLVDLPGKPAFRAYHFGHTWSTMVIGKIFEMVCNFIVVFFNFSKM